ncbi:MAG: aminotransferase class IV, partial [Alphaproteobacteria bacterium]
MPRIAYVNGRYVPHQHAQVHIEDRGYQFADGIYEVCSVLDGKLLDLEGHLARLSRSLAALKIAEPFHRPALLQIIRQVINRNRVRDGVVYMQITRGVAPRDHKFPTQTMCPSMVVTAKAFNWRVLEARAEKGIKAQSAPDERWARCDIKSVALLPNVLARQAAIEAGADEA